jgi:hypothetical protein
MVVWRIVEDGRDVARASSHVRNPFPATCSLASREGHFNNNSVGGSSPDTFLSGRPNTSFEWEDSCPLLFLWPFLRPIDGCLNSASRCLFLQHRARQLNPPASRTPTGDPSRGLESGQWQLKAAQGLGPVKRVPVAPPTEVRNRASVPRRGRISKNERLRASGLSQKQEAILRALRDQQAQMQGRGVSLVRFLE